MGRLIDADKLYEDLANSLSYIMGDGSDGKAIDTYVTIGDIIREVMYKQPTAYDPDKVVEQLEADKRHTFDGCINKRYAIEIVKGGGVDGN